MFGDGIYLSSEMHVSQMFSPVNVGWRQSQLGAEMSCVALCEFIDHPVHLKRHAKGLFNFCSLFIISLE